MRQAYVHVAQLVMEPDADVRTPGAAVTAALCGHWDHEQPCTLAPHFTSAEGVQDQLHVRVLFAAQPEDESEVRRRIELALSGRAEYPAGFTTTWAMVRTSPGEVSAEEAAHAERLIQS